MTGQPMTREPAAPSSREASSARPTYWSATGPDDAPPIVFVHGAMMARHVWAPQVDALADRFRCITVDQPGHGSRREQAFTLDVAVGNVVEAIDREAGGRAVVVGLSLGGYVAMAVAARHPEKVRGLVVAGSTRDPQGLSWLGFHLYGLFLRSVPERMVRAVALAWFRQRYGRAVATSITAGGHFSRGGSRAVRSIAGERFRERLRAYGGPVLVINGEFDLVFRVGAGRFVEGIPGLRNHTIPRAGHLSNVDKPEVFTGLVEDFVETLPT